MNAEIKKLSCIIALSTLFSSSAIAEYEYYFINKGTGSHLDFEIKKNTNKYFAYRVSVNDYVSSERESENGIGSVVLFDAKATRALIDWHPFGNGFRSTIGLILNQHEFKFITAPDSNDEIPFLYIPLNKDALNVKGNIIFDRFSPYFGFGWGNPPSEKFSNIQYSVDLGVIYHGTPRLDNLQVDGSLLEINNHVTDQLNDAFDQESEELQADLNDEKFLPYVSIGLTMVF